MPWKKSLLGIEGQKKVLFIIRRIESEIMQLQ